MDELTSLSGRTPPQQGPKAEGEGCETVGKEEDGADGEKHGVPEEELVRSDDTRAGVDDDDHNGHLKGQAQQPEAPSHNQVRRLRLGFSHVGGQL
jgi:hypothetical protein